MSRMRLGFARSDSWPLSCVLGLVLVAVMAVPVVLAQDELSEDEYEPIDSTACADCHEASTHGSGYETEISHSVHEGVECLDYHVDRDTVPHRPITDKDFHVGCKGCRSCHEDAAEEYRFHGRSRIGQCEDMPPCSACHGSHDILPPR